MKCTSSLLPACLAVLALPWGYAMAILVPPTGSTGPIVASSPAKPKLVVKVEFVDEGDGAWGTDEQRQQIVAKLKEELTAEWGHDFKYRRKGATKDETAKGVDIDVQIGTADPAKREVQVTMHGKGVSGTGSLGSATLGQPKVEVWPGNFTDNYLKEDLITSIEKTAAHELGHMFCANDQNERLIPMKMAQTWRRNEYAKNNKLPGETDEQAFARVNASRIFNPWDRIRMLQNIRNYLENGGKTCNSWDTTEVGLGTRRDSLAPLDDPPVDDESGIVNFAITMVTASPGADWYFGFLNPGDDHAYGTSDDWFNAKWFSEMAIEVDWDPTDGIDLWELYDDTPDAVVSLLHMGWYDFGIQRVSDAQLFSLSDYGQLTLMDPQYNSIFGTWVWSRAEMDFNIDGDPEPDVTFILSANLSNIVVQGSADAPAYAENKYGTGFVLIPEPVTMLGLFLGVSAVGTYLRKRVKAAV